MDKNKDYAIDNEQIARFAKAMGHPARITILNFLASMDSCYFGDIHNELPIAKATVSQHLKELRDMGLIHGEIDGLKINYCLCGSTIAEHLDKFDSFFKPIKTVEICCSTSCE